jgi:phosphoribosyl 1,2-cyclic phosphodiesterase
MKITLWGVRGSIENSSPELSNYGTRTSCTLVQEANSTLILDGGSGLQQFNSLHYSEKRIDILLTHLHMEHIVGLGFFSPFFNPDQEVHLWGPAAEQNLRSRLGRYLSPPLFPVLLRDLPCQLIFHEVGNTDFEINHFKIKSQFVIHRGPTLGFRVAGKHSVFTYIPDHEPALGPNGMIQDPRWISGYDLAENAHLLYHDGQYTAAEYQAKKGWGHSNVEDALLFGALCKVKKILIAHHDPSHTDSQISELYHSLMSKHLDCPEFEMAREGKEFELP